MDHANEQVLLFGVGKELHIPLTAVVADHCKAGCGVFRSVIVQDFGESPIHLVGFSRLCGEPASPVALRGHQLSLGRNEVFVGLDVPLDGAKAALESKLCVRR